MKRKRGVDNEDGNDWREEEINERLPDRKKRKKIAPSKVDNLNVDEEETNNVENLNIEDDEEEDEDLMEEDEESDDEEEESDDENLPNKPEPGIIEKIEVERFMCHRKLKVNLKTHINVITGANGSGKSAIIIALQAVLGGKKPRQVNRVTDLIQTVNGHPHPDGCFIRIYLRNRGIDAHERDVFGKRIIVERSISASGTSSYKIMSANEEVIYRTKKDLDRILNFFNIRLRNPCVIMSQDQAKTFLAGADSKMKYQFFLEATQLKGMVEDLKKTKENQKAMKKLLESHEEKLEKLDKEVIDMKDEMDTTNRISTLREEIKNLSSKLLWLVVRKCEEKMRKCDEKIQEIRAELEKEEAGLAVLEGEAEVKIREDEEISNLIEAELRKKRRLNEELHEKRDELKDLEEEKAAIEGQIEDDKAMLRNNELRIKKIMKKIKEIENRVPETQEQEINYTEEELQKLKVKMGRAKDEEKERREAAVGLDSQAELDKEAYDDAQRALDEKASENRKIKEKIRSLESSEKDPLEIFDKWTILLVNAINRERGWSQPPIGPLFMYINVRDRDWGGAVEKVLTKNIKTYLVHTERDMRKLKTLCDRIHVYRPNICLFPFENRVYNVRDRPTDMSVDQMLMIHLDTVRKHNFRCPPLGTVEATIRNFLIDFQQTERTIMIADRHDCERRFFEQRPQNAIRAVSKNGTEMSWIKGRIRAYVSRNIHQRSNYFMESKDIKSNVQRLQRKLELGLVREGELRKLMISARKRMTMSRGKRGKCQDRIRELVRYQKTTERKIGKLVKKLERLRETTEGQDEERDEEVKEQRDRMEKLERDIQKIRLRLSNHERAMEEKEPEKDRIEGELKRIERERKPISDTIQKLQDQASKKEEELSIIRMKQRDFDQNISRNKRVIKIITQKKEQQEKDRQQAEENAKREAPDREKFELTEEERVMTFDALERAIESEITEINRRITRERARIQGRSVEQVRKEYSKKYGMLKKTQKHVQDCKKNAELIKKSYLMRYKKWLKIRQDVSKWAGMAFNRCLHIRGHAGKLIFDHDQCRLITEVRLNRSTTKNETSQLSGGEKSFSTVCLLAAMWEVCESPFRCLDEIDIFMDNVNRKVALDILVHTSMKQNLSKTQIILVTPQSTRSFLEVSGLAYETREERDLDRKRRKEHIHIIRMKEPQRDGMSQSRITRYLPRNRRVQEEEEEED